MGSASFGGYSQVFNCSLQTQITIIDIYIYIYSISILWGLTDGMCIVKNSNFQQFLYIFLCMNILSSAYYVTQCKSNLLVFAYTLAYLIYLRSLTSNADSSYYTHVPWVSHEHYGMQRHSCYMSPTTHNTLLRENFDTPFPTQPYPRTLCTLI